MVSSAARRSRDHPRIRGEHSRRRRAPMFALGSSPHTRGAPIEERRHGHQIGIIPAYAGSTPASTATAAAQRDHPRIRGEHTCAAAAAPGSSGSSPHTRGALPLVVGDEDTHRIIPAYAGSTSGPPPAGSARPDHPRIRGEHLVNPFLFVLVIGSSPHTRGAPTRCLRRSSGRGIIPAYAGSTVVPIPGETLAWDHPRIRGEHTRKSLQYQGSPP